jgi:hypothetical protein
VDADGTHTARMTRAELRAWIEDALARHDRDGRERTETISDVTAEEIVDAVWGRLPLEIRRRTTRSQVQASLIMLTVRHGIAVTRENSGADADADPAVGPRPLGAGEP